MRRLPHVVWLALALTLPFGATAQPWPQRAIKIVVPYAPGGNSDVVARITGQYMQEKLGASVVVENKAGAGGLVGSDAVAKAPPDGYTLLLGAIGPMTIVPALQPTPYDPLVDFAPISLLNTNPLMLIVNPAVPAKSVAELIALARARPHTLNFGSSGEGGLTHISGELFKSMTGVDLVHVPYRGGNLATNALLAGEIQVVFANYSDALPQIAGGTVRPLGITTKTRAPQSPDVPTIAEAGVPGYECESWNGLLAPKGTPPEIVRRLATLFAAMVREPAIQQRMIDVGSIAVASTPEDFHTLLASEIAKFSKLAKDANIKLQ
ncbi:MAG: tripartite tricarboxylate transporter substrate binding protein [Alphaproteobacteria bacterium]|nr:tripartite tricarboxylate transporter substrate binding protein [Alphaproteobacteria bacterium]